MNALIRIADVLEDGARRWPHHLAYADARREVAYAQLAYAVRCACIALREHGVTRGERVAVYAPKQYETVVSLLAINALGAIFVPVNPQLKEAQVLHILRDSGAKLLITGMQRLKRMPEVHDAMGAGGVLLTEALAEVVHVRLGTVPDIAVGMADAASATVTLAGLSAVDDDPAAILYTSGSTGAPKGVVVTQRNLVSGAQSVAAYQRLHSSDVILGVLPLSFDAGLSQLTTALVAGACYAPLDFMQASEVPRYCDARNVTSITGVPPLWMQLAAVKWSDTSRSRIRRFANTGGHLATPLLERLQDLYVNADPYLMYGLTEAFRSTWLAPEDVATRPASIGKAVPNAEVLVLRADGSECDVDEPGELVHRGSFVTLGYWNQPQLTAQRFRPLPNVHKQIPRPGVAVWSGDIVRRDAEGYLYFVARGDDMIKTSGYRVSPTEVEDVLFARPHVREAAVFGVPHPVLGRAIVACVVSSLDADTCRTDIVRICREALPTYMAPLIIDVQESLPRNPNGKIDRPALKALHTDAFADALDVVQAAASRARQAAQQTSVQTESNTEETVAATHLTLEQPVRARAVEPVAVAGSVATPSGSSAPPSHAAHGSGVTRRAGIDAGTLTLSGGTIVMPPAQAFNAVQADERHSGYRHLLLPQARFARPRGEGKLTADEAVRLAPGGPASLRIAPPGQSLSDLAVDAALDLRDQMGSERLARTTHVVIASSSLNEKIGDSVVGRVQYELGLNHSTPFALGQNGTLGWYSALLLLDGMLGPDDQALLVLSDKWLYPFFRQFGDLVGFGDAAAALLVSRAPSAEQADATCWGTVSSVAMEFGDSITDPWGESPEAVRDALAPLAARTVRRALDAAGRAPERIDWCVPAGFDASFAARVADCAAIPVGARVQHETSGHWSSADSAASMIRLAASLEVGETRVALVWDAAMHGAAAAAVLELRGGFGAAEHFDGDAL